jgi:hypothetical protein
MGGTCGVQLFVLRPSRDSPRFTEIVNFMSHVAPCYPKVTEPRAAG